ncbi:acyl carrier protein [Cystoisospora suis]|uniref:Acyl carrier protein n=1 Tax=Cystoisospora suis TaxID=483139 RepID=A0A2C6KKB6_9APIC|nr:acyl carrier protein [Cystoisospora suis]
MSGFAAGIIMQSRTSQLLFLRGRSTTLPFLGKQSGLQLQSWMFHSEKRVLVLRHERVVMSRVQPAAWQLGPYPHRRCIGSSAGRRQDTTLKDSEDATSARQSSVDDTNFEAVLQHILGMAKRYIKEGATIRADQKLEEMHTRDERSWDCLDSVEFVLDVEEIFGISIPDERADELQTFEIAAFVAGQLREKGEQFPRREDSPVAAR